MALPFSRLVHLKSLLSEVDKSRQNVATTIGLLAASGLDHHRQVPEMCYLLQRFFNLTSCGFFWAQADGTMADAWCLTPGFLSSEALASCREYQESGTRNWPTFKENVLGGPRAGYLLPFQNETFYQSAHYAATYGALNAKYVLDVVLHDGKRPYGAYLLMRSAEQGPFTPDERRLLEQLIPVFNEAFKSTDSPDGHYSSKELTGFALVGADGKCKAMSEEAQRIVWMLSRPEPGSFADPDAPALETSLERLVAAAASAVRSGSSLPAKIENRWGRFELMLEPEPRTGNTIVALHRKIPLASRLAFCLAKLDLPPMRQMAAWLLAQNLSRDEIAETLGISIETVTSHIKLIYKATGASSSHGLLLKLAS